MFSEKVLQEIQFELPPEFLNQPDGEVRALLPIVLFSKQLLLDRLQLHLKQILPLQKDFELALLRVTGAVLVSQLGKRDDAKLFVEQQVLLLVAQQPVLTGLGEDFLKSGVESGQKGN